MISNFHLEVDENCPRVSYCAASGGDSLLTFRDNPAVPIFKGEELGP